MAATQKNGEKKGKALSLELSQHGDWSQKRKWSFRKRVRRDWRDTQRLRALADLLQDPSLNSQYTPAARSDL